MKSINSGLKRLVPSAVLCLGLVSLAHAQPTGGGMPGYPNMGPGMMGQGSMRPGMMGNEYMERGMPGQGMGMGMPMSPWMEQYHGGAMMPGMGMGHGFLYGLNLNEEQQDKIFNILHKQAPRQRDSMKLLQKSMNALHDLARSGNYSDANAQSFARAVGQASADLALMHVQTERQIYEILTPEQRRLLDERGYGTRNRPGCAAGPGTPPMPRR